MCNPLKQRISYGLREIDENTYYPIRNYRQNFNEETLDL